MQKQDNKLDKKIIEKQWDKIFNSYSKYSRHAEWKSNIEIPKEPNFWGIKCS